MHHHAKELDYVGNFDSSFLYYYTRGYVLTVSKITTKNLCKCDFSNFPFDEHTCKLFIGSATDELRDLEFTSHFEVDRRLQNVIQYDLDYRPMEEMKTGYQTVGLNVSVVGVDIYMSRRYGQFVYNVFLPTFVLTVTSSISFFIPMSEIPGRMTFLVTIFLMLINTANSIRTLSPQADTMNSLEAWIFACETFVFLTIGEYAFLLK